MRPTGLTGAPRPLKPSLPSQAVTQGYTIGDAALQSGCTPEGIRYYEREGIVPRPARGSGNYRRYTEADIARLQFIRRVRDLGFSLDEARSLLTLASGNPQRSCEDVGRLARAHLDQVVEKLAQLAVLRNQLANLVNECQCNVDIARCGIISALS